MMDWLHALALWLLGLVNKVVQAWARFWFTPTDPAILGAIRILVGSVVLYAHLTSAARVLDFIGPNAWMDPQGIEELKALRSQGQDLDGEPFDGWQGAHSIWFWVQDPFWVVALYVVFLAATLLYTLGLFSRVTAVLVWLGHIGYIHRAVVIWFGMDTMLAFLTLYVMIGVVFGPRGGALSLDYVIYRYRESLRSLRGRVRTMPDLSPRPSVAANLAMRLIQIHMCIIYLAAGLAKLQGGSWWQGSALWAILVTPEFALVDLTWLGKDQYLWQVVSVTGGFFTLFTEIGFVFLIWNRTMRPVMLTCVVLMHAGIGIFMGLGAFQMAMVAACLAFIAAPTVHRALEFLFKGRGGYRFIYDRHDAGQVRLAGWIHAADPWNQVEVLDAHEKGASATAGALVTPEGTTVRGLHACVRLTRSLRVMWLLWPVLTLGFLRAGREEPSHVEKSRQPETPAKAKR